MGRRGSSLALVGLHWSSLAFVGRRGSLWALVDLRCPSLPIVGFIGFRGSSWVVDSSLLFIDLRWPSLGCIGLRWAALAVDGLGRLVIVVVGWWLPLVGGCDDGGACLPSSESSTRRTQ